MTTVTITGTITGAYKLHAPITVLSIASTGYVKGGATYGVYSPTTATGAYTVHNDGRINGGKYGVDLGGGTITNGSAADTTAMIRGGVDGVRTHTKAATVSNFGTIASTGVGYIYGVSLGAGGLITNGSATDSAATIYGDRAGVNAYAAYGGQISVANYGTIKSVDSGVLARGSSQVNNFGTITSIGTTAFSRGMSYGGRVVNGSSTDTKAMVEGYYAGVFSTESVVNYATIESHGTAASTSGANFSTGGFLTNGSASDTTAVISGASGVRTYAGTVDNFGTVTGKNGAGVYSGLSGGRYTHVTNGAPGDASALIEGKSSGVRIAGGIIDNLGTIIGLSASGAGYSAYNAGVILGPSFDGAGLNRVDNRGLIKGVNLGAFVFGTLTNYGTIEATAAGGYSVKLYGTLQVEAGSKLIGKVAGSGSTLDFASGKGVISRLGGGTILAGGAEYLNFGTLTVDSGAAFTTTGVGTVASGGVTSLDIIGTLDVAGTLNVSGTLFDSGFVNYGAGHLAGAGQVEFLEGTSTISVGVNLTTAHVLVSGASTVIDVSSPNFEGAVTVTGAWDQTAGSVYVSYQDQLKLTGAGAKLSGTLKGGGTVSLSGAGDTLSAITLSVGQTAIAAASGTLTGIIDVTSVLTVTSPDLKVSGTTQLTGGGLIQLAHLATNEIIGLTSTSLLENSDKIDGGGQLGGGQMRLNNEAAGTILAIGAVGLVINTGTHGVTNAGLIESNGAGGLVIDSSVANTGLLEARGGNLTVDGAVTGAGTVTISAGAASFAGAFNENVTFITKGELALAHSQAYKATIGGFSKTGATSLDLEDISFTGASASYSGTTTSGILTVTDGTHTARIAFAGNYLASTWALGNDGNGGVTVTDPPAAHPLIGAMAGFAPAAATSAGAGQSAAANAHPILASPG